jgi:polygalacturonase
MADNNIGWSIFMIPLTRITRSRQIVRPTLFAGGLASLAAIVLAAVINLLSVCNGEAAPASQSGIPKPEIPAKVFNIVDRGAKADGTTNNSKAIQTAIDAAALAGGGRVVIPAGKFLSSPIRLKDRIDLHLEKGAKLLVSQDFEDFPMERNRRISFLGGTNLKDVRISGEGTIDGQGHPWWQAFLKVKGTATGFPRPQLICLVKCERVELDGITTVNPPNTHCSLGQSKDITIHNVTMTAPGDSPNTDALNLNTVENVVITNCNISTGDDNIVLLGSGNNDSANPKVRNVTIRDCKFGFGHGLSIGSYTSGGVQNVRAENISFDGTTAGIRMKAWRDRGGLVRNLTYKNLTMNTVRYPIYISSYYPKDPRSPAEDLPDKGNHKLPEWTDIQIEDVTITGAKNSIIIWGLPDQRIKGITLKNIKASAAQGAVIFHSDTVFSGVEITPESGPALQTYDAKVVGMEGVPFEGTYKAK